MMFAMFYMWPLCIPFSVVVCIDCIKQLYNKIGGQFDERLLLWQPSDIFLYLAVIIIICFMLCWRIKYDDDDDDHIFHFSK